MLKNNEQKKPVTSQQVLSAFESFRQHFLEYLHAFSAKEKGKERLLEKLDQLEDPSDFFALFNKNISHFKFVDSSIQRALKVCSEGYNKEYIEEINKKIEDLDTQHYKAVTESKDKDIEAGAILQMRFLKDILLVDNLLRRYLSQEEKLNENRSGNKPR